MTNGRKAHGKFPGCVEVNLFPMLLSSLCGVAVRGEGREGEHLTQINITDNCQITGKCVLTNTSEHCTVFMANMIVWSGKSHPGALVQSSEKSFLAEAFAVGESDKCFFSENVGIILMPSFY